MVAARINFEKVVKAVKGELDHSGYKKIVSLKKSYFVLLNLDLREEFGTLNTKSHYTPILIMIDTICFILLGF